MEDFRPDVVVSDILTVAPALAAEKAGRRRATLIPHVYPVHQPGMPFFSVGAQPPRTALGKAIWRAWLPVLTSGLRRGRREMNETRAAVGLARWLGSMEGSAPSWPWWRRSPSSSIRGDAGACRGDRADGVRAVLLEIELPPGDAPLVPVAPSTAQDPELRLVRAALEALAEEPVRVVATTNRLGSGTPPDAPSNAVVVDWLSYSQLMPKAALVVSTGARHGGAALAAGTPAQPPGGWGHGGELGAGGLGRRRADAAVAVDGRIAAALGGATDPGRREPPERAATIAQWARARTIWRAERGAEFVEQLAD